MRYSKTIFLVVAGLMISTPLARTSGRPGQSEERIYDEQEGKALVENLKSQMPENSLFTGQLRIRRDGKRVSLPLKYTVRVAENGWQGIYETEATIHSPAEKLVVVHRFGQPNEYHLSQASAGNSRDTSPKVLTGANAVVPFAGSDYWLTDLGLEFLHWPSQRIVKNAKITMRQTRPCKVLESINPSPREGDYALVLSWIDAEYGVPVYAEAYDASGKRHKTFSVRGFKKVRNHWEPNELEIIDEKTDSRTSLALTSSAAQ